MYVFAYMHMQWLKPPSVYLHVGIDLIGQLPQIKKGNKYIFTLVDYLSKWPEAAPLPDKTATGVALFFPSCFVGAWFDYLAVCK